MTSSTAPIKQPTANYWGIEMEYKDAFGTWHDTDTLTIKALLAAMGADDRDPTLKEDEPVLVICAGEERELPTSATIKLETGETIAANRHLPAGIPIGYHQIYFDNSGRSIRLIVSPGKCWLPENLKTWGWAVQLYAARSCRSWGIGDFADLEQLVSWSAKDLDAGIILVNPLGASTPIIPQQASPYFPSSRRFLNPLWICIERVPGAEGGKLPRLEELAQSGRKLNVDRLIDRDKVFTLKMEALNLLWLQFSGDPSYEKFCLDQGADLDTFAVYCVLAEEHKVGWRGWPEDYRHPANVAVAHFKQKEQNRILFFKWLQWLLDEQLAVCAEGLSLMQDLPVGFDPDGADAWAWQDMLAKRIAVGAPPDEFNTQGQIWGLPPFIPHKLRAAGYEPFIQTIRAAFRHGGGLRIDHVMGLFRLFWIPEGLSGGQGAYVRYDPDELLAIVALESQRACAYVVGEDLGTVEVGVRQKLSKYGVLLYQLLWFDKDPPETYSREALAAVSTHDLPTIAGLWTGSDLKKQRELGMRPNEESTTEIRNRLKTNAKLSDQSSIKAVITATYSLLAEAPSRILIATLEDAEMVEERPNMPAAPKNPNWSIALPQPIETLMKSDVPLQIAARLRRTASPLSTNT